MISILRAAEAAAGAETPTQSEAAPGNTQDGIPVSSDSTADSPGSWVEVFSSTSFAYTKLIVVCAEPPSDTIHWDVGVGGAGSEAVLVDGLYTAEGGHSHEIAYHCDIAVAAGSRLAIRITNTMDTTVVATKLRQVIGFG
jgi:hypothetical protein